MNLKALNKLSYGVYVVTSKWNENFSGCTITTAMQLTAMEPPRMMVAVNKENYTHELIHNSKKANISVLDNKSKLELIAQFGFRTGKNYDKLQNVETKIRKKRSSYFNAKYNSLF